MSGMRYMVKLSGISSFFEEYKFNRRLLSSDDGKDFCTSCTGAVGLLDFNSLKFLFKDRNPRLIYHIYFVGQYYHFLLCPNHFFKEL